ncbi:MAG: PAS/PAC sensor-containing diguanylate cyclase/phosphodiesterase, partial [Halothiobacillaceae bacterium]
MTAPLPQKQTFDPLILIGLSVGLFITAILIYIAYTATISHEQEEHNARSSLIKDHLIRKINSIDEVIHGMKTLFDASNEVGADEFRLLAENILTRHDYIATAQYLPRVRDIDKNDFERHMRESGFVSFSISNHKRTATDPPLATADYYPILYQEPLSPLNASELGKNYRSFETIRPALERAIDSAQASITPLDPFATQKNEYLTVKAIYAGKDTPDTLVTRRSSANGLLALRIDAAKLLSTEIESHTELTLRLNRTDIHNNPVTLMHHAPMLSPTASNYPITQFSSHFTFDSGDERFVLDIDHPLYLDEINLVLITTALIIGILITLLITLQARRISEKTVGLQQRNSQIEALVKHRTNELALEKERAQITLGSIGDAVITTDQNCIVKYLNPIAERITGWAESDAVNRPISEILHIVNEETRAELANAVATCIAFKQVVRIRESALIISQHGEETAAEIAAAPIVEKDNAVIGSVLIAHDVTSAKQMAKLMAYQATHDTLTQLPNRTLLIDRLKQSLARAPWLKKSLAVLFLDLDRFKLVNDTLGHDVGDALLQQVAQRLISCLRDGDTVSRLGGDEFIVVLTDISHISDVRILAHKINQLFEQPFQLAKDEFFTSTSIGISLFPKDGEDPHVLLKKADMAMYRAKASGKNNFVFYSEEMSTESAKNLSIETELRRALEREEFELHFQPQYDCKTHRMVGAEALIRWRHPKGYLIPPNDFIAIAEETGLIIPIGQWVIEQACHANVKWQRQGLAIVPIAVNIAGLQFQRGRLLADVTAALQRSQLPPQYLELELTEGILARDAEASTETLKKLKETGVSLSIDDFGTGYSSLAYLKRFPVSTLKVDRCFVKDITTDPDDAAICAAIIAMAHSLNLRVIAEGVETQEQLEFLTTHRCDTIQGYYFSKPLPETNFVALLPR